MSIDTYLIFLPACFAINMAFGPNNVLSLSNGAREGVRVSIAASVGRLIAFAAMIAIAGLGLGALLLASQTLFSVLKLGGAAYLVWLGIKLLRAKPEDFSQLSAPATPLELPAPDRWRRLARQEFLVASGNPKAILVFTAFFPQFVDRVNYAAGFAILGATFLALELVAIALYALLGARVGRMGGGAKRLRLFNRVSGSLMIAFGLMLAFVKRPTLA